MINRMLDYRPALEEVVDYMMDQTKHQFRSQGKRSGGWQPLSPQWTAFKAKHRFRPEILRQKRKGPTLFKSVTKKGASGQVLSVGPHELQFGTKIPYAAIHQHGGTGPKGQIIPQRPFLFTTPKDREAIGDLLREYVAVPFERASRDTSSYRPRRLGTVTGVRAFGGKKMMIRGPRGRFIGATSLLGEGEPWFG